MMSLDSRFSADDRPSAFSFGGVFPLVLWLGGLLRIQSIKRDPKRPCDDQSGKGWYCDVTA